jgi:hypothetical protein
LLALFLAFGKRRAELVALKDQANYQRKVLNSYSIPLLDSLINIVLAATLVTYCFYTFSATVTPESHLMMLTIPFVVYGLFRYLFLLHQDTDGRAPEELLFSDRHLQLTILLWGISIITILYILSKE